MENENQFTIGEETFELRRPTLKVLNDFKSASGFDLLVKKDSPEALFPDLRNSAKVLGVILLHQPKDGKALMTFQQVSDYAYENATPQDFKEIVRFFCSQFQQSSSDSPGDANPNQREKILPGN